MTSPASPLVYSATTSPNALRWIATFCPTLTLSFSLTRSSTNPPWVARTECALLPMKMFVAFRLGHVSPTAEKHFQHVRERLSLGFDLLDRQRRRRC